MALERMRWSRKSGIAGLARVSPLNTARSVLHPTIRVLVQTWSHTVPNLSVAGLTNAEHSHSLLQVPLSTGVEARTAGGAGFEDIRWNRRKARQI
jgi:hypothetical protein